MNLYRIFVPGGIVAAASILLQCTGCAGPERRATDTSSVVAGHAVVRTARTQIGAPYKYGGEAPETGFDCSGLARWIYRQHGTALPRTTRTQLTAGREVKQNGIQAGDLLFYRISRAGALHVGIYSGGGTMIHSPKSGGRVREESIQKRYWVSRFLGARRPFLAPGSTS